MSFFLTVYTTSLLKSSLCLPLRYLWANDYKGKGISGREYYIFCSRVMVGIIFTDTNLYRLTKGKLTLQTKDGAVLHVYEINVMT